MSITNQLNKQIELYMNSQQILIQQLRTDDEEEEPEERARIGYHDVQQKTGKIFFENRSVYLWGVVDDKSAKDVVSKLIIAGSRQTRRRN